MEAERDDPLVRDLWWALKIAFTAVAVCAVVVLGSNIIIRSLW